MRARWSWLALAAVLAVGLAIGSGLRLGPGRLTPAERVARLDQVIGCPSCADLSVAESDASTAVAIRQYVAQQVRVGASDHAIERQLEASYGPGVLLRPPGSVVGTLVWVLPVGFGVVAIAVLTALFWERRRRRPQPPGAGLSDEDRALVESALGPGGGR